MLKNYFKTAWRNLIRNKMYSFIKIGGFALGIAACLLIALFIRDEFSYDTHYAKESQVYRMILVNSYKGETSKQVWLPAPMAKALKDEFPEIEKSGRYLDSELFGAGANQIRRTDRQENSFEERISYFDQDLLEILEIPIIKGDPLHALDEPKTLVISKRKADQYFPHENPIGKTMIINNDKDRIYKIGGVIEGFPATSHINFDFLLSLEGAPFGKYEQSAWENTNYPTYVLVKPGTHMENLEKKLSTINSKYYLPAFKKMGFPDAEKVIDINSFKLQPVRDIYLRSSDIGDNISKSDIRFVRMFGAVGFFILLLACINFINLSTAKSANRAKEVGVRKVVGSKSSHLIKQFLIEAFIFTFLSFALGIALGLISLPFFNALSNKSLYIPWNEWQLYPILLLFGVLTGLLAGVYPAFYLSSFRPISVLKGNLSKGSRNASLRSFLVVFQFAISLILIVSTLVIYRQMQYILNKKVGFDKDQVVLLHGTNTMGDQIKTFKQELLRLSEVTHATISDYLPVKGTKRNGNTFNNEGKFGGDDQVGAQIWKVDHDYLQTLGIKIIEGRNFDVTRQTDEQSIIINKTMVKKLGLENPIGARITNGRLWTVIGVVENFHYESFYNEISPLGMTLGNSPNILSIKINTSDMAGTMKKVKDLWSKFSPDQPIRYAFLDENFAQMYEDVKRMTLIFSTFAVLAIIVACLGLFALSAFMVELRLKEICIRIVLGASSSNIFQLLTKNFLQLVIISLIIAIPLSYLLMQKWLENFAYRIKISWDIFLVAGITAVLIALFTISFQTIKAAIIKPVDGLKSE